MASSQTRSPPLSATLMMMAVLRYLAIGVKRQAGLSLADAALPISQKMRSHRDVP